MKTYKKIAIITSLSFLTGLIAVFFLHPAVSAVEPQTAILQNEDIIVVYEPPLKDAAGEVLRIYPVLKQELEEIFTWHLDVKPRVVLINNNQTFKKIAGNAFIVAFAVPAGNLIVIDYVLLVLHQCLEILILIHQ